MFEFILKEYKKIYQFDIKKIKELSPLEASSLIILVICVLAVFISWIKVKLYVTAIFTFFLVCDYIFIMIHVWNRDKDKNLYYMSKYEDEEIGELVDLLSELGLYKKEAVQWLIDVCNQKLNLKDRSLVKPIKEFFTLIILPIILLATGRVINTLDWKDAIQIIILLMSVLMIGFGLVYMVYPIVDDLSNRKRKMIGAFKEDLEYILVCTF